MQKSKIILDLDFYIIEASILSFILAAEPMSNCNK